MHAPGTSRAQMHVTCWRASLCVMLKLEASPLWTPEHRPLTPGPCYCYSVGYWPLDHSELLQLSIRAYGHETYWYIVQKVIFEWLHDSSVGVEGGGIYQETPSVIAATQVGLFLAEMIIVVMGLVEYSAKAKCGHRHFLDTQASSHCLVTYPHSVTLSAIPYSLWFWQESSILPWGGSSWLCRLFHHRISCFYTKPTNYDNWYHETKGCSQLCLQSVYLNLSPLYLNSMAPVAWGADCTLAAWDWRHAVLFLLMPGERES